MDIISFFAHVDDRTARSLIKAMNSLRENGGETLHLLLHTDGGSTNAGLLIHNFIKASGIKVVAVNMGVVASMGTVIFSAAEERISLPHARLLFHPNTWTFANEKLGVFQIEEKVNIMKKEHDLISSIIGCATGRTAEEIKELMFGHQSLSAGEAKELGLVHDIRDFQIPKDAKLTMIDDSQPEPAQFFPVVGPMPGVRRPARGLPQRVAPVAPPAPLINPPDLPTDGMQ